jgi:hypothetical protein
VSAPSHGGTPGQRQLHGILGGVLILAVAGFYAIVLPRAATGADGQQIAAGETAPVRGLQMTFPAGWSRSDEGTYTKGGATFQVIGPLPVDDLAARIGDHIESLESDRGEHWVVGEIQRLATGAGDEAVTVEGRSPIGVHQVWIVSHDGEAVTLVGTATESVSPLISEEIRKMALSTRFTGDG